MLVEFAVTNFLSFREEQRLSMVASPKHANPESVIETPALGKERLLKSVVIYGPNASGKSNLFKALAFVRDLVTNSFNRGIEQGTGAQPFRPTDEAHQEPSRFELHFIQGGIRYEYRLVVDTMVIREETLYAYPHGRAQRWYHRRHDTEHNVPHIESGSMLRSRLREAQGITPPVPSAPVDVHEPLLQSR